MRGGYNHVNGQFQAKTSEFKNKKIAIPGISEIITPIESKFEDQLS